MSNGYRTTGSRVLLVDDDVHIRRLLGDVLGDEGFEVITAANGAEALVLTQQQCPDVILLDLAMPVMDGRTFYARLRSNGFHALPVVFISATGARRAQRELGADGAIEKPFDIDDVVAEVRRLVPAA